LRPSVTVNAEDFKQLIDDKGNLDAAAREGKQYEHVPSPLMAKTITPQAAEALQSSGIKCLDVRSNPHLEQLAAQKLCRISTLERLECSGDPNLISPPPEVAKGGGAESMRFLRAWEKDGGVNTELALFLVGDGEAGKTSVMKALMNEKGNTAEHIGKDTRTVGMDMHDWMIGAGLILKIKDVGGQHVYMKLHELFVLDRAMYVFLWRADRAMEETLEGSTKWLNLLQSCVPGVSVVPVVTHIDCVGEDELQRKSKEVQQALKRWHDKQHSLPQAKFAQIVRVLNDGHSYSVNCLRGDGIAELRTVLLDVAATTRGFHEPLPKSWINLRGKVRSMSRTKKFISWNEYVQVCKQCGIEDNMVLSVTSFLHETLELRYFGIAAMRRQAADLEDFMTTALATGKRDFWDLGDDARTVFDIIDQDKSGAIDERELERFLQDHGLPNADIKAMMRAADDDRSGKIEFDEFRKRFENAHSTAYGDVLATTVYLDAEWMVDVLKGIVRHDHAALHQYFKDKGILDLTHQARRLRVQGIISKDLLRGNYLWPGVRTDFWSKVMEPANVTNVATDTTKVAGRDITAYKYERQLWVDGEGGLKKVVEGEHDKKVAVGLLVGFNIIKKTGADYSDTSKVTSDYFCPDLLPAHKKDTTDSRSHKKDATDSRAPEAMARLEATAFGGGRAAAKPGSAATKTQLEAQRKEAGKIESLKELDTVSCLYWSKLRYSELPHGFWNLLFMLIRDKASSGSTSTLVHTFFLLSAKIQISQTRSENGDITLQVRASTRSAFDTAMAGLGKAQKFYAGMALWQLSSSEISAAESATIAEPAQVLVMTAASLVQLGSKEIDAFAKNTACADAIQWYENAIQGTQAHEKAKAMGDDGLARNAALVKRTCLPSLEALQSRLTRRSATFILEGSLSLGDVSAGMVDLVEGRLLPKYRHLVQSAERAKLSQEETHAASILRLSSPKPAGRPTCVHESCIAVASMESATGAISSASAVEDILDVLVQAGRGGTGHDDICARACTALAAKSNIDPASVLALVDALVEVILAHESKRDVQAWACMALGKVSHQNVKAKHRIAEREGIKHVISAMDRHKEDEAVQLSACQLLLCLSSEKHLRSEIEKAGGVGCVTRAMAAASDSANQLQQTVEPLLKHLNVSIGRRDAGKRLEEHFLKTTSHRIDRPLSTPGSSIVALPGQTPTSYSAEWIYTLICVLDDYFSNFEISKEIFSPHRPYHGKAQVVIVLLDEAACRSQDLCARFAELERQGCEVIGVPMPGYKISDYNKWWPDAMPAFQNHTLFFDCRTGPDGDQWNKPWEDKMRKELMPQIHQFLEEWTETRTTLVTAVDRGPNGDQRSNSEEDRTRSESFVDVPGGGNGPVLGTLQERVYVSKEEMRESMLPCPRCLERGEADLGAFKRGLLTPIHAHAHAHTHMCTHTMV